MASSSAEVNTFTAFEAYNFLADKKFCAGWENIRKTCEEDEQLMAIKLLEAKIFYYSKFYEVVDIHGYQQYVASKEITGTQDKVCQL